MKDFEWEYDLVTKGFFEDSEGNLYVAGEASNPSEDEDGEVMDMDSLKACFSKYMENPVIKFMHDKAPQWKGAIGTVVWKAVDSAGKVWETSFGQKPFLVAKFVKGTIPDWMYKAIKEKVYKGFSIGGKAARNGNRLLMKSWLETSVVDVPSAKGSFFAVLKGGIVMEDEQLEKAWENLGEATQALSEEFEGYRLRKSVDSAYEVLKGGPGSGQKGHHTE